MPYPDNAHACSVAQVLAAAMLGGSMSGIPQGTQSFSVEVVCRSVADADDVVGYLRMSGEKAAAEGHSPGPGLVETVHQDGAAVRITLRRS